MYSGHIWGPNSIVRFINGSNNNNNNNKDTYIANTLEASLSRFLVSASGDDQTMILWEVQTAYPNSLIDTAVENREIVSLCFTNNKKDFLKTNAMNQMESNPFITGEDNEDDYSPSVLKLPKIVSHHTSITDEGGKSTKKLLVKSDKSLTNHSYVSHGGKTIQILPSICLCFSPRIHFI